MSEAGRSRLRKNLHQVLLPVSGKGRSCALTIRQALEDTQLRPEVWSHAVGAFTWVVLKC